MSSMSDSPATKTAGGLGTVAVPSEVPGLVSQATTAATGNIQLLEEELSVSKRQVVAGKLRISTRTETHDEIAETTLDRNVLDVSRVPIDRIVDVAPKVRTEGDTTIVPIVEERLVMVKQLYLKEELRVRHSVERETIRESVPLRSQHAVVERLDADGRAVIDQDVTQTTPR